MKVAPSILATLVCLGIFGSNIPPCKAMGGVTTITYGGAENEKDQVSQNTFITPHECKIILISYMPDPDADLTSFKFHDFGCELLDEDPPDAAGGGNHRVGTGQEYIIQFNDEQMQDMLDKVETGDVIPNSSILVFSEGIIELRDDAIYVTPGVDIGAFIEEGEALTSVKSRAEGDKKILMVRVTDKDGLVVPRDAATIGDDILGYNGDPLNPKSQLLACSNGKLNLSSQEVEGQSAFGVIDVTIDASFKDRHFPVVNEAIKRAVAAKLGIDRLPGPFDHILFIVHSITGGSWSGVAVVNGWMSAYVGPHSQHTGLVMHELGHNFGLAHSGKLPRDRLNEYLDHTCVMGGGFPVLHEDDEGRMCYNGGKSWQLGWYDDTTIEVDVNNAPWFGTMVGTASYANNNPDKRPVVIKLNRISSDIDYYIQFNHVTGINIDNPMAKNQVTIVEQGQEAGDHADSWILAMLSAGESHSFRDFDSSGQDLIVTVNHINLNADPGYADISICLGCSATPTVHPSELPTSSPSSMPSETCSNSPLKLVRNRKRKRCNRMTPRNCKVNSVKSHCPLKCGACDEYGSSDSTGTFMLKRRKRTCNWVKDLLTSDPDKFQEFCARDHAISSTCRETCGFVNVRTTDG